MSRDLQMVQDQKTALSKFPSYHPKRTEYEEMLTSEFDEIMKHKKRYEAQAANFDSLHKWGQVRLVFLFFVLILLVIIRYFCFRALSSRCSGSRAI